MLRSMKNVRGSAIMAKDGELGHVHDFLFDDRTWIVRYVVVETGSWLASRRVLLSPSVSGRPDWEKRVLPVDLTMDQVRDSPDIDADKPVSRQHEIAMSLYYGWPAYWPTEPVPVPLPEPAETNKEEGDPNLRSAREVTTYVAAASDGEIGRIDDLILEDANWFIRYLVIHTGSWFGGQNLLVSTRSASSISWEKQKVELVHSREEL